MSATGLASKRIQRSKRILIVDDEEVVRTVIRSALDLPGTYLVEAETGEQAISLLLSEPFDLIIADKNLPGITGLDVLRRARKADPLMGTLVITGYASRESAEEAMAIGVDDYLVKPFDLDSLVSKVRDALQRRFARKSVRIRQAPPAISAPRPIPAPRPAAVPRSPAPRPPAIEPQPTPGADPARQVVLLDHDLDSRPALIVVSRALGHEVQIAEDLQAVLAAVRNKTVTWIICDLDLLNQDPVTAGFLRSALILSPHLRFMAIASNRNLEGVIDAIRRGAHQVVYRPMPLPGELRNLLLAFFNSTLKR